MSTASTHSRKPVARRYGSNVSNADRMSRRMSRTEPKPVSYHEAYTYALRSAYLHHLLQPRTKRKQYVQAPKAISRTSTASSIGDLVKDFSGLSGSKSGKFPHGFMSPLEKRMQGVVVGTEKLPGFNDAALKRTFAEAYTAFTETGFRRRMDKERRVEDLVLIFYSNATKALQKGKAPDDDSWKAMVDRHVAMFVRLLSHCLRDQGSLSDRVELMGRLSTLEKKLLTQDQDMSVGVGPKDTYVEVITPISYDVKDMPMVQVVAQIFGLKHSQVQSDIDSNMTVWTEEAALSDLKSYQHCLNSGSKRTLQVDDFDLDEAYQAWKKSEGPDIQQMILDILHVKPELTKTSGSTNKPLPAINITTKTSSPEPAWPYGDMSKVTSPTQSRNTSLDTSVDMSGLRLSDDSSTPSLYLEQATYVFIPPNARAYYRCILVHATSYDQLQQATDVSVEYSPLSKQSMELMTELSIRWRVPQFSRLVLFMDVAAQRFMDQDIGLEELDTAFEFAKSPPQETKRSGTLAHGALSTFESAQWTLSDFMLYRQVLSNLHDALLRDLYDVMQHCFDSKPPSAGPVMVVLDTHIYSDPNFIKNEEAMELFSDQLGKGLQEKAATVYRNYLEKEIPASLDQWQFYHVVQLGKAVVKLCQRIQKRYSRNPEIMGVNPLQILVETMFPTFETDAGEIIGRILQVARDNSIEVDLQDGFDLYKELVEIRRIHKDALPDTPFAFHIEGLLAEFVWRWIKVASDRMNQLVDSAIAQDKFQVRSEGTTDEDRHSESIIDLFRIFNETTNQIFQLNWDDDEHHARYMTALSKAFGVGLSRYCEVIEKDFTDEMNRPSPAQIAIASQTKQEKWMQFAKDTWNNKEKIEPFQFYPKSFVKLNNIEFAVQQLDKLEKMMNVDACSEVLKKLQPNQPRRPHKFVFTIKIVEAEDLKACDTNGYSDPYVVLVDEFQKRLTKTRVITRNLSPRWDESVDVTVQGPVNIIAMIWDSDTFGEDDYIGRTSMKLDPAHFSDYLPKECWLNLDTQGRLLLRISMEGERDDIQFHFGKAFRHLKRTERDMTRKITDKLSQYINMSLSHEALRGLMSRGITLTSVASMWKGRQSVMAPPSYTALDVENALKPLFAYFDENFAIMNQTLTQASMVMVMTRLWKEVLAAIESMLVPPLSDRPSSQKQLTQQEMDVVFRWLELLFDFFNARDEETGEAMGVPSDVLKSPKWHELASLNFFYFDTTENLIRTSERMASATAQRAQAQRNRMSAPASLSASFGAAMGMTNGRRGSKSVLLSRNLGTMKKAKEEKRKEAQADPSDDIILKILRMRPESQAIGYLRDRSRQKERMAASAAAEQIVRQSLQQNAGVGRFGPGGVPIRRGAVG